ncbi:MAG TPA: hypothetical protein VIX73_12900 [Kofleriaceae bacterium]|jgi:hypothetical protein
MPTLRIPAVLAFTIVGGAVTAVVACGDGKPGTDAGACSVVCVPRGSGSNGCTPATCAQGSNHDVCPVGCVPEPIV